MAHTLWHNREHARTHAHAHLHTYTPLPLQSPLHKEHQELIMHKPGQASRFCAHKHTDTQTWTGSGRALCTDVYTATLFR